MLCHRSQQELQNILRVLGTLKPTQWSLVSAGGLYKGKPSCRGSIFAAQSSQQELRVAQPTTARAQSRLCNLPTLANATLPRTYSTSSFSKMNGAKSKPCFSTLVLSVFFPWLTFPCWQTFYPFIFLSLLPSLSPSPCFLSLCTLWTAAAVLKSKVQ